MYSERGERRALGQKNMMNCMTEKYYTYNGGSEVVSIYIYYVSP